MPSSSATSDDDAAVDAGDLALAPLVSSTPHAHHPKPSRTSDGGLPELTATSPSSSASSSTPSGNYDPANARVILAGVTPHNTGNRDVKAILDLAAYSECYRKGLVEKNVKARPAIVRSTLALKTDEKGRVNATTLNGGVIPESTGNCIMQ